MTKPTAFRSIVLIAAVLVFSWNQPVASGQDVSLEVHTSDDRSEYHIGEPIALRLVFTSSSKQYLVDTSFRYPEFQARQDEFLISPVEGSSDPMEDYRHALSRSGANFDCCGGIQVFSRLGEKPITLDLFLTRYVRFSKAGRYVLSIRDRRVSVVRSSWSEPSQVIELMSKPVNLTIAPADATWQQQQLSSALEVLKKRPAGVDANACEILTSLGTPEAEVAMAESLEDGYEPPRCGFSFAFLGAKNRKLVLEHMQERLESPQARVSTQFVETMATLATLEYGGGTDFYHRQAEARKRIIDELFALLDEKKGAARFATVSTLVNESLINTGSEDSARRSQLLRIASEVFDELSVQAQSTLLSARWKDIAGPAMVPVLKRCAQAEGTVTCGFLQGELLLARLNELSPTDAREVILADMQKENPRFRASVLAILPDKELPEIDAVLRQRLTSKNANLDTTAGLIQRYATGAISGAVESFLDEKGLEQLGGQVEPNLIAYLMRVEPDIGAQKLRAALAARNGTGWYKYLLRDVAQRIPSQNIQPIAIDTLSDTDQEVVQSAVQALALVGDEHAKAALSERLAEWHAKWMGRDRDMFWNPGDRPITDDRNLGDELIPAIGTGAGWLLTETDQRQLLQSAVTENQKQQVHQFVDAAKNRPIPITITNLRFPSVQILIAQYSYESVDPAKRKLSQFPVGSSFLLQSSPSESSEMQNTVAEIESFLTERGMRIETFKPQ